MIILDLENPWVGRECRAKEEMEEALLAINKEDYLQSKLVYLCHFHEEPTQFFQTCDHSESTILSEVWEDNY